MRISGQEWLERGGIGSPWAAWQWSKVRGWHIWSRMVGNGAATAQGEHLAAGRVNAGKDRWQMQWQQRASAEAMGWAARSWKATEQAAHADGQQVRRAQKEGVGRRARADCRPRNWDLCQAAERLFPETGPGYPRGRCAPLHHEFSGLLPESCLCLIKMAGR